MFKLLSVLALVAAVTGSAVELTDANHEELMFNSGKNSFVKFLAPW